jgi:hypothetical protein
MYILWLLPLLVAVVYPQQQTVSTEAYVVVVSFNYAKSRQIMPAVEPVSIPPAPAMIPANKNFQRNVRANDPMGARDPNLDTVDGRSAALEKAVQESRTVQEKTVNGYAYRAKIKNNSDKRIEIIFWEYQFSDSQNSDPITRRQFLCGVNIAPNKEKELMGFRRAGPSDVVDASTAAAKPTLQENVLINRVEYADGSIWQRRDWKFDEIRLSYARAVNTPWGTEMCRGL